MLRVAFRCASGQCRGLAQTASPIVESKMERINVPLSVELFDDIKTKIHGSGRSIDKILVNVIEKDGTKKDYLMNRHISTPLTCGKHISRSLVANSGLAIVSYPSGATQIVSVNTRLDQPCEIEFIDYKTAVKAQADAINEAFWRSASVLTAAALFEAFPSKSALPSKGSVKDGYFSAQLNKSEWNPSSEELLELERRIHSFFTSNSFFDVLHVPDSVATEYGFESSIQICKIDNYVCKVDGPTISAPSQFGRFNLIASAVKNGNTVVGGVALPSGQHTTSYNWDLICKNATARFKSQ